MILIVGSWENIFVLQNSKNAILDIIKQLTNLCNNTKNCLNQIMNFL